MKRNIGIRMIMLFVSQVVLLAFAATLWAADAPPTLNSNDCIKCHADQPAQINDKGARHKTFPCQNCHVNHRPSSKNNIPVCSQCHKDKPHFLTPGCLTCHTNPHTPLVISFAPNLTEPCLTCHTPQIKQLRENKSKHTALFCSTCHAEVHRKIPQCTQCHKPHSADVTVADCLKCHKPHMPKNVTYAADINNKLCAACHKNPYNLLTASKAKHGTFACAFCHQDKHKAMPKCQDCHGDKHPQGLMAKFPKCGECHGIAHDLNNWKPAAATAPAAAAPAAKKKKN
jgi:predicted CXXCH cytochrome family protein